MNTAKIGIIGCGAIGSALAEYVDNNLKKHITEIILYDVDKGRTDALAGRLSDPLTASSVEDAVERSDLMIEAAGSEVVPYIMSVVLAKNKDIIAMSVGGFLGNESLLDEARSKGIKVILPSGAISGIDALKAAKLSGIEKVTITTRKSIRSIKGAPYLEANNINVDIITGEDVVFEGTAREAVKGFPKNVNVSAILSIAGIGADKTNVRIVVSPLYKTNTHEIEVISASGKLIMSAENVPSPTNPKTSYLAILAAEAALEQYFDSVRIGT